MKKIISLWSLVFGLWSVMFCLGDVSAFADDKPLKVVASTTFFKNLVEHIGGEHVNVHAVASPKFNVHFVQPKPSDVVKTAKADLFVFAGLDLEAWADPLLEASGRHDLFRGQTRNLDLSQGILLKNVPELLSRSQGDIHAFGNPHYTLDPLNAKIMAQTVSRKLQEVDPEHAQEYSQNESAFLAKLENKIAEWKSLCAHCAGKEIFAYHDEMVYLTDFLGIKEGGYLEAKPGVSPSPKHLAELESYARANKVRAIAGASFYPQKTIRKFAEKIGAKTAVILQAPGEVKGTEDLWAFYDYNVSQLAGALK